MNPKLENITPGEILLEEYMKPMGLTQNGLARALHVPPRRVNEIIHGKRAVTLDTSLRLGRYFGQSPRFWLNLQIECDFRNAGQLARGGPGGEADGSGGIEGGVGFRHAKG